VPGVSTRTFGRAILQFAAWYPVSRDIETSMRAELGAVIATEREGIPSSLLFRTGGDTTVRGYAFESLGVKSGDAIRPRPLPGGRQRRSNALDRRQLGHRGVRRRRQRRRRTFRSEAPGARLRARPSTRTPIGPFRLDVAYGQDTGKVRIHFSVGLSF
jgi:translocation and assembly module TamA